MKLLLAILIFLFAVPLFLSVALDGLMSGRHGYTDVTLEHLATGHLPDSRHVRVEGRLVREGAPDDVSGRGGYFFAVIGGDELESVAMGDGWTPVPGRTPVIACVSGDRLPPEAFFRPMGSARSIVTPSVVLEGSRTGLSYVPESIARDLGLAEDAEVVVIDAVTGEIGAVMGVTGGVLGVLFLWWGIRLVRSWRRERRADRELVRRVLADREAALAGTDAPPPLPGADQPPAPRSATPAPRPRFRVNLPWGKVAVVAVLIGGALAQFAGKAAPSVDNVARGVGKAADDVTVPAPGSGKGATRSGPKTELPGAGEIGGSAGDLVGPGKTHLTLPEPPKPTEPPTGRISLTVAPRESLDRFERKEGMTFELVRTKVVSEVSGRMTGGSEVNETETNRDLPDRGRGEFTWVTLSKGTKEDGVRLVQTIGLSVEGGYLELFWASGDLEFVHGGTWEGLERGEACVLRFTDAGRAQFAAGLLPLYEHHTGKGLDEQDVTDKSVDARWDDPPEYSVTTGGDGLELELVRPAKASVRARFWM